MKNKIIRFKYSKSIGYLAFFLTFFLIFLYSTFPSEYLGNLIIRSINKQTPYDISAEKVNVSPFLNFSLKNIRVMVDGREVLFIDDLDIKPSLRTIFSDRLDLPFSATALSGGLDGVIRLDPNSKKVYEFNARANGLNIQKIISSTAKRGEARSYPSFAGFLYGEIDISLADQPSGTFKFEIPNLDISNISVEGFSLPDFNDFKTIISGKILNTDMLFDEFSFNGVHTQLLLKGKIPVPWLINKESIIDLPFKFQTTDPKLKVVKNLLDKKKILAMLGDGSLGGKIEGTLGNPRIGKHNTGMF